MKILHTVEFYHPSVGGMQEVVKQLSERLVKRGHSVTVATTNLPGRNSNEINGVKIQEFAIKGNTIRGISGNTLAYQEYLKSAHFDIVVNFAAQQWATDLALPLLKEINGAKVFVPTGFSALYDPAYKTYFQQMQQWMKEYDMNVFLSDDYRDINFAREHAIPNRVLIPNGAGEDEFLSDSAQNIRQKLGIPNQHFIVLTVGSHTGSKGHAETIKIFTNAAIGPASLVIVGNSGRHPCVVFCKTKQYIFNNLQRIMMGKKRIVSRSLTRDETVAIYKEADLFLFPSNIECSPIVLFECMASRTPFLSTDVGNAAEIVSWSGSGQILPTVHDRLGRSHADIQASAKIMEDLYHDDSKRSEMARAGFSAWQKRFSWEKITLQYEELYESLLKKVHI